MLRNVYSLVGFQNEDYACHGGKAGGSPLRRKSAPGICTEQVNDRRDNDRCDDVVGQKEGRTWSVPYTSNLIRDSPPLSIQTSVSSESPLEFRKLGTSESPTSGSCEAEYISHTPERFVRFHSMPEASPQKKDVYYQALLPSQRLRAAPLPGNETAALVRPPSLLLERRRLSKKAELEAASKDGLTIMPEIVVELWRIPPPPPPKPNVRGRKRRVKTVSVPLERCLGCLDGMRLYAKDFLIELAFGFEIEQRVGGGRPQQRRQ